MEFRFEMALCGWLEATTDWIVARQLGGAVATPGSRIVDVVCLQPGPEFEARTAVTSKEIPSLAIESDVGVGAAVFWREAFDCSSDHARTVVKQAVDCGFFETERRKGRQYVRQTTRYPDWIGGLVGIENKPDLGTPGDLTRQLRLDVSLALFDQVILATESYVTRAHLNRLPDAVGVWRFDPETSDHTVVREPTSLSVDKPGVELQATEPLQTDVEFVTVAEKASKRRRIAERAYGKGWRTDEFPSCRRFELTEDGRPHCSWFDRVINPAVDCGVGCEGYEFGEPPAVDLDSIRDARSPWVADPEGRSRTQSGLDRFS
jgi:hypothetical protein